MKFTLTAVVASTLALVSARACPQPEVQAATIKPSDITIFRLNALIQDGPYTQNSSIQEYKGGLAINVQQNSSCEKAGSNYVSLALDRTNNNALNIYSDLPPITAYTDRSGMGQGILRFAVGVAPPLPKNAERGPWKITDDLELVFSPGNGDVGFQACTSDGGKTFIVWMQGVKNPAGYSDCTPFVAQVLPVDSQDPNKCAYNDAYYN